MVFCAGDDLRWEAWMRMDVHVKESMGPREVDSVFVVFDCAGKARVWCVVDVERASLCGKELEGGAEGGPVRATLLIGHS